MGSTTQPPIANRPIKENWTNYLVADIYKKYNKNKNSDLDINEINIFRNEAKLKGINKLASENGFKPEAVQMALSLIDADMHAGNIYEAFNPSSGSFDKEKAKEELSKINGNNVADIYEEYQVLTDDAHTFWGWQYAHHSLASDIFEKYKFSEANKLANNIVRAMLVAARKKGIVMTNVLDRYNEAISKKDTEKAIAALEEMGNRFTYDKKMSIGAIDHNLKPKVLAGPISDINRNKLETIAKKHSLTPTKDIVGDGKLGNTKSKFINFTDEIMRKVYNIIEELLQDNVMREKMLACYKKQDNCFVTYFPKNNSRYCLSENGLITENITTKVSVGDADITAFVAAVKNEMMFDLFVSNDYDKIKAYIISLFK